MGCVGQNFFHHGAPDWSNFAAFAGAAAGLEALGLAAFFAEGFFAGVLAVVGFFVAFFAMMFIPPRAGVARSPKSKVQSG